MKISFNFSFSDIYLLLTVLVPVPVPVPVPHSFFFTFIDFFFTKPISHVQSQPQFLNQEHTDFRQGSLPRNPPKILVFFLHSTIKLKMQDPAAMFSQMNGNPQFPEQEHLKCPRCDSSNTKFCYYNNYNLSQPRHFCKNCRRYWTKGGVLRNIPVGGGSRKNSKRNSSSTTPAPAPAPVPAGSSSSSSPPQDAQPSEEPYRLMLINAAQPASLNHDRPILDLNGGNFSSLSTPHMGHFGNSTDGPNSDGSNFTDHGQTQSSTHDPGSWNEDPPEVYRPNCWSGSNVWPDNLAMYTPQSTSFQQFIEFPSRRTQDS